MLTTALLATALASSLSGAPELRRAYDAIFDARFDDLPALLAAACPPAPAEACQLMEVVGLWWQIQLGRQNSAQDARFEMRVNAAIATAEAWTKRESARADAWFYLGGAYGARAQWRGLRGEPRAAARDGKRIKESLEKALALDPALHDARFGIGLYRYYADVAPAIARRVSCWSKRRTISWDCCTSGTRNGPTARWNCCARCMSVTRETTPSWWRSPNLSNSFKCMTTRSAPIARCSRRSRAAIDRRSPIARARGCAASAFASADARRDESR